MALILRAMPGIAALLLSSALSACVGLDAIGAIGSMGSVAGSVGSASKAGGAVAGAAKSAPVAASPAPAPATPPATSARPPQPAATSPVSLAPREAPGARQAAQTGARLAGAMVNTGVAVSNVAIVGLAAAGAKQRAAASCRVECEGLAQSIGCPAETTPVCQCEQKPYTACK